MHATTVYLGRTAQMQKKNAAAPRLTPGSKSLPTHVQQQQGAMIEHHGSVGKRSGIGHTLSGHRTHMCRALAAYIHSRQNCRPAGASEPANSEGTAALAAQPQQAPARAGVGSGQAAATDGSAALPVLWARGPHKKHQKTPKNTRHGSLLCKRQRHTFAGNGARMVTWGAVVQGAAVLRSWPG